MMGSYQVADRPGRWLRVIAPEDTVETLERDLRDRFGPRLVAVRDDTKPRSAQSAPGATGQRRHKWRHVERHHYLCTVCGMERRSGVCPDTVLWFTTFARPGETPQRSRRTPPCAGEHPSEQR